MTRAFKIARQSGVVLLALLISACASMSHSNSPKNSPSSDSKSGSVNAWTTKALAAALATPPRAQVDINLDADRKPAQLMTFFGVERGMTVVELIAGYGFMTEVLSITVGPTGKVYAQQEGPGIVLDLRIENHRLANVQRVNARVIPIAPGSADFVITVMNLHDIYNSDLPLTKNAMAYMHSLLKPGAVLGVVDHVGLPDADNTKLHRMQKQQAIDVVTAAGFVLESDSDLLAHATDDHTKRVDDPSIRWKTDQFVLKFRKAK